MSASCVVYSEHRITHARIHTPVFTSVNPQPSHPSNPPASPLVYTSNPAAQTTVLPLGVLPGQFVRLIAGILEISTEAQADRG